MVGLSAVVRRAFARDFFGYYHKLKGVLALVKPQKPITVKVIGDMMKALHIHANHRALVMLHEKVVANMRYVLSSSCRRPCVWGYADSMLNLANAERQRITPRACRPSSPQSAPTLRLWRYVLLLVLLT